MNSSSDPAGRRLSRRRVLQLGAAGSVVAGTGVGGFELFKALSADEAVAVGPQAAAVRATEAARFSTGRVVQKTLRPGPATVDLGGRVVSTWAFDGGVPGPEIRVNRGDELRVRVANQLTESTTVHWHGVALRNDMDGVPGLTMEAIQPDSDYEYRYLVPDTGTYWYHPHVGVQLDTGLIGPLIVEDPQEPSPYDDEVVLMLDDWTDGLGRSPDQILRDLGSQGMAGMDMSEQAATITPAKPLGSDTGDVDYPAHLINGRLPEAPVTVRTSPGRRIRMRLINGASDTAYRFAIGGHRLQVTHTDGFAVRPVEVDTLIMGMGERYDVVVTAGDGVFPIVAVPEGKSHPAARAVLRTAAGAVPPVGEQPVELRKTMLSYDDLVPPADVRLPTRGLDRELDLRLTMVDGGRQWFINDAPYTDTTPLPVQQGERVRLVMTNETTMFHPMHVHGHTFELTRPDPPGARKDTVNVLPKQTLAIDLHADNPGQWLVHCHNAYHGELGMMTVLSYQA